MDDDGLLQSFFDEAADLLADLESCLLKLETTPGDQELLNRGFRAIHTIKGNSGMLGFERITRVAHALEDLLDRLRRGVFPLNTAGADLLLLSADAIKTLFSEAKGEPTKEMNDESLIATLKAFVAQEEFDAAGRAQRPSAPPSDSASSIEVPRIGEILLQELAVTGPQLESALSKQKLIGEILVEEKVVSAERVAGALEKQKAIAQKQESATIRVSTEKIDKLINLVGELVITQSMIGQLVTHFRADRLPLLEGVVAQMERNSRDLQERVMAIRMLPIRNAFSRFPRLVRDLAAQCGKQIVIHLKGEETELDKTVIERISDPLTHLIRNSVDHGIESPEVREAQGKPREGTVTLNAFHKGGSVFIEVSDDGRGLNRERILQKAIERGLISEGENLTDEQVNRLIFRPGFSTAEKVTDVSGRGVGMDVVQRNIDALGGTVGISTEPGRGTSFLIKLPLTLAIMDGLSVQVGEELYIIPLLSIIESIRPKQSDLGQIVGRGEVVKARGEFLPIIRLHEIFHVVPKVRDATRGLLVIVEQEGERIALQVDDLLGQHQVVIKSLETNYERVQGISGATIMGDGHPAMILDIAGLVQIARGTGAEAYQYAA